MLAFTARLFLKQKGERARNLPARPKSFDYIFKEEITGVEVLHSQSDQAVHLNRYGAWYTTSPALRDWFRRWTRGGGLAVR